jgi:hypothetical protein
MVIVARHAIAVSIEPCDAAREEIEHGFVT